MTTMDCLEIDYLLDRQRVRITCRVADAPVKTFLYGGPAGGQPLKVELVALEPACGIVRYVVSAPDGVLLEGALFEATLDRLSPENLANYVFAMAVHGPLVGMEGDEALRDRITSVLKPARNPCPPRCDNPN